MQRIFDNIGSNMNRFIYREQDAFWSESIKPSFRGLHASDLCHLWYSGSYTSFKAGI